MHRDKQQLTKTGHILLYALAAGSLIEQAILFGQIRRHLYPEVEEYYADRRMDATLRRLHKQGWLRVEYKETKKIIKLTKKGEIEALLQKSYTDGMTKKWDGKWRIVIFDIPENARGIRNRLRSLLKSFGFQALQASVYVYPFALNKAGIEFLKKSGLMRYIRFARIDAFDDDADLRKSFKSVLPKNDGRHN